MLTVKVVRPGMFDSTIEEELVEATSVSLDSRGILIQQEHGALLYSIDGRQRPLDYSRELGDRQSACVNPTAAEACIPKGHLSEVAFYVMNRHGATISTYRF